MSDLLTLTNQLKQNITDKNQTISSENTNLLEKIKAMNQVAQAILEKVGNFTTNSKTLQQNIDSQARQIADLTQQLTAAKAQHTEAETQLARLQNDLAESQGRGAEADTLKQRLTELQQQLQTSNNQIEQLTSSIQQASTSINEMIGSVNTPSEAARNQELNALVETLRGHIENIDRAISVQPVQPIPQPDTPQPPVQQQQPAEPLPPVQPATPVQPAAPGQPPEVEQREEWQLTAQEKALLRNRNQSGDPAVAEAKARLLQDPSLRKLLAEKPNLVIQGDIAKRGGYSYKKKYRTPSTVTLHSSSRRSSSKRSTRSSSKRKNKMGGRRISRRKY
jgi:DNA repair exonuclease SbcCD ATPase subunit